MEQEQEYQHPHLEIEMRPVLEQLYDYENDDMTAQKLRDKLEGLQLVRGVEPPKYVNEFLKTYHSLSETEDFVMCKDEAKTLFLDNIRDPDFDSLKDNLRMQQDSQSLEKIAHAVFFFDAIAA